MESTHTNILKYRAYVDGLRAIAVLPVLFFHADLGFTGGYVGVDIFFVISGFLITSLILRELEAGHFSFVKFWERRVRRIMPAVTVVVLASLVAGWFLLLPQAFKELAESAVAQTLFSSNIYFWIKSWIGVGYFTPAAEVKPLLHTWSLSVEEQFYLFFPFFLFAIMRYARRFLVPIILFLGGASFCFSVFSSYVYPFANFYLLPTRSWELLTGAFLATIPAQQHPSARPLMEVLSWSGLLAILCAVFFYDHETRFPGVSALLPCVGAALIIWANGHSLTSSGKFLALRPVVFIGLISYSLYLWHWPLLVFAKYWATDPISMETRILILLGSLILSVLSWKFVEMPFRKRVILKTPMQIFGYAGAIVALILIMGVAIFKSQGVPARLPEDALRFANAESEVKGPFKVGVSLKEALAGKFVQISAVGGESQIDVIIWGDSHAMAVMPVFNDLSKEYSVQAVAAIHSSTVPLLGYISEKSDLKSDSVPYNTAVVEFIHSKRVSNVVIVANWSGYPDAAQLRRSLFSTLDALKGSGAKVWILRQVPKQRWNVPRVLGTVAWRGGDPEKFGLPVSEYYEQLHIQEPLFSDLATEFEMVTILDPTKLFVAGSLCRVADGGNALYWDDNHLTVAGAMLLRPLFEPIFAGAKK